MTGFERAQPDRPFALRYRARRHERLSFPPRIVVRTAYRLFGDDATYLAIDVGIGLYSQRVGPMSGRWVN